MDVLPEVARQNSAVSGLQNVAAKTAARFAAAPTTPQTTTLPDGRVLDRAGKVIFTPAPVTKLGAK
jgi:hypothetical protein